ncbi:ubiquitin carboxyl-terminal hydrolase-domain-containing protein [Pterulicium gracile]|uniref:Ubiquitin carboxyl-terminal hydrolase-domain-containing protein n=1 Tax=Pterulicium gracile TaxID=1884261 RepID=A0A5C3R0G7_9AGAR|nr:ubiquitin carboxyl-terminal hydrolase-domain-containing protein [Pterula gracilis]
MPTYTPVSPIHTYSAANNGISALAFDPVADTLWTGLVNGTVVARHSAAHPFRGITINVKAGAVSKISAGENHIRALGAGSPGLGSWTKGGANEWFYHHSSTDATSNATITAFSPESNSARQLAIASTALELMFIDSMTGVYVRRVNTPSMINHLSFSHSLLVSGSLDGYVRVHDSRTGMKSDRNSSALGRAHQGSIHGLQCSGNYVFTVGFGIRHSHTVPDNFVKVFDLRAMRALPPVPFSDGAAYINVVPRRSSSICVTSNTGIVQILDVNNLNSPEANEFHALDLPSAAHITATAISPTGAYIAFSDAHGSIHLLSAAAEATDVTLPFNGTTDSQPPTLPHEQEPPEEIEWTDSTPLNSIGLPYYKEPLLSSWSEVLGPRKSTGTYFPPPARIPFQRLSLRYSENIGYSSLPKEFKGTRNVTILPNKGRNGKQGARFRSDKGKDSLANVASFDSLTDEIPKEYRHVEIEYSKFGVEDFDFDYYNKTPYSGLETHIFNSYTNSLVQVLHHCSPVTRLATSHIAIDCRVERCLLCELGFVSRMLEDSKGRNCQSSNFCKTVGLIAEGVDNSLVDYGREPHLVTKPVDRIQAFHRFLIDQLAERANIFPVPSIRIGRSASFAQPTLASPMSQLIGLTWTETKSCTSCKFFQEQVKDSHVFNLSYLGVREKEGRDFESIVKSSLFKHITHKASCQGCRHTTNHVTHRTIASKNLPPVLALNASCHSEEHLKLWINTGKSRFLPAGNIQIRGNGVGADEAAVEYRVRALVVQTAGKHKHPHLSAIIRVSDAEKRGAEFKSPWFVFNDFVVTNVTEDDALGFSGSWKVPAIVYLERVDIDSMLNLSCLPQQMNPAILCRDTSISQNRMPSMIKQRLLTYDKLPKPGTKIAIDSEFVAMQQEDSEHRSDGSKKVIRPAIYGLARVSVLRGDENEGEVPFIDDHIHTTEPIVDYVTQYSGIKYGDLDPTLSPHTLTPLKVVYKKLRLLVDLGCVFIGHGLTKDFRTINIHVPPEQVVDTVDIYYLASRGRRLSLKFLTWYMLDKRIQDGVHDSIEDARFALMLYRKHQQLKDEGKWKETLEELYKVGRQQNWQVPPAPDDLMFEQTMANMIQSTNTMDIRAQQGFPTTPVKRFNSQQHQGGPSGYPTSQPGTPGGGPGAYPRMGTPETSYYRNNMGM